MNNSVHLRIASALQIVLGILSIVLAQFLLGSADASMMQGATEASLGILVLYYASNAFKILAGILGLLLAGRKSLVTVILGGLLFLAQLVPFLQTQGNIPLILLHAVLLAIPYYYLHNAYKLYRGAAR